MRQRHEAHEVEGSYAAVDGIFPEGVMRQALAGRESPCTT